MSQISIRAENDTKKMAEKACADIDLSLSAATNVYLKKSERRLPFEVSIDPFYSDANIQRLRRSVEQMEATGGTVHEVNVDVSGAIR